MEPEKKDPPQNGISLIIPNKTTIDFLKPDTLEAPSSEEQALSQKIDDLGDISKLSRPEYIRYLTLLHVRVYKMSFEMATEYATLSRDADEAGGPKKLSRDKCIRLRALCYISQARISEPEAMELAALWQEQVEAGYESKGAKVISKLPPEKYARLNVLQTRFDILRKHNLPNHGEDIPLKKTLGRTRR